MDFDVDAERKYLIILYIQSGVLDEITEDRLMGDAFLSGAPGFSRPPGEARISWSLESGGEVLAEGASWDKTHRMAHHVGHDFRGVEIGSFHAAPGVHYRLRIQAESLEPTLDAASPEIRVWAGGAESERVYAAKIMVGLKIFGLLVAIGIIVLVRGMARQSR